tara:strand:- start:7226 stop:7507 length:282 start_codon:yes stop_codon:yes gene_type:complete
MNKKLNKAVTTRFSGEERVSLQIEAERRGCTVADVIRSSWTHYQEQQHLQQLLLKLEQRQRKVQFEMLCTILDLAESDRKQALTQLHEKGVKF